MALYKEFWDHAVAAMNASIPSLETCAIPPQFEHKEETCGKGKREEVVTTTSYAFRSAELQKIRTAYVISTSVLEVLNFVIFPRANYDLPFFGADLVTLPGGSLIAIDMQPIFHDVRYRTRYTEPVLPIFNRYKDVLTWGGNFPDEAKPFFSPAFLWTRQQDPEIIRTSVFDAFKEYFDAYLKFVSAAKPVTNAHRLECIQASQQRYLDYRAEKDPARGMLTRIYGEEWTEAYIHDFLFDLTA